MKRFVQCALLFCVSVNLMAANIGGFREAVVVSQEPQAWDSFLTDVAQWERISEGRVSPELLWGECDVATHRLYRNPGTDRGYLRVLETAPHCRRGSYHRPNDQTWETGGHFDLNVRVKGLAGLRDRLMATGWHANSDPVRFTFGPFDVTEWIAHGPDGVAIAFIERHNPKLEGWPQLKVISRLFNSTQIVADMAAARAFYEDVLGFGEYMQTKGASDKPGPNVLGLPQEMAATVVREIVILHPEGVNDGSIELIAFDGASGRDFSAASEPWRTGLSSLRFPVGDLNRFIGRLGEKGWDIQAGVTTADLPPYGRVKMVGLVSPEGAWLEFFEVLP